MYDLEVYFEAYNQYCEPRQNFDFWKTELSFKFYLFRKVSIWVYYFSLDGRMESFVLFRHENESSEFLRKTISNMLDSCKNIKKIKMLQ